LKRIYLDHNATSPMSGRVLDVLGCALSELPGNASSPHAEGQAARVALERARERMADRLGVHHSRVLFTSGGSESNNAAVRGAVASGLKAGRPAHVVVATPEHPSVLETARALRSRGIDVSELPVDSRGCVDPGDLEGVLAAKPACLVSVMHANNETGVIQPLLDLARIARESGAAFHADAVQALGKIPVRDEIAAADFISLSAHKIGGPVGVGALVVGDGAIFEPVITGGAQESRRRAGTEPVALAVAFAEALEAAEEDRGEVSARLASFRDLIEGAILDLAPRAVVHGRGAPRLPNTTNFFVPGAPGRTLVMQMDIAGYAVSTGAACSTGSSRPSHVLTAMGRSQDEALDSLRISLGPATSREDIAGFLSALASALSRWPAAETTLEATGATR